jgi:hypothetical protein
MKGRYQMKMVQIALAGILCFSLVMPVPQAEISDGVMAELFNGMADIVEGNMNNPSQCLAQLEKFIAANRARFEEWKRTVEANVEKYRANPRQMPSPEEMRRMQEEMARSEGAQAMGRWTAALMQFSIRNSDVMDDFSAALEEVSPRPAEYDRY